MPSKTSIDRVPDDVVRAAQVLGRAGKLDRVLSRSTGRAVIGRYIGEAVRAELVPGLRAAVDSFHRAQQAGRIVHRGALDAYRFRARRTTFR